MDKTVPAFPYPTPQATAEFEKVCQKGTCPYLYEWFGRLMIFEKKLKLRNGDINGE